MHHAGVNAFKRLVAKKIKKKLKQIEHDEKLQLTYMKKQLVMLAGGQLLPVQCGSNFIPRLCALTGPDGLPYNGEYHRHL